MGLTSSKPSSGSEAPLEAQVTVSPTRVSRTSLTPVMR